MKVSRNFSPKMLLVALAAAASMCLSIPLSAFAAGPVGPGGVPGGVTVVDSDVNGESWGRAGGRNITYTVNNPSGFTSMTWGAQGANPVQLAFDNFVNLPSEALGLNNGLSDLTNGVAVWTGQHTIPLAVVAPLTLDTRFTLTVVDGSNNPIILATVPGGNVPGINVLSPGGSFTATLLFEANHNGVWTPVLDLFDALDTQTSNPPGQGGPVLTTFASGFFFEVDVVTGLSVDDHDANMLAQTNMIKNDLSTLDGKIEFLTIDAINRLIQLAGEHDGIHNWINTNHQDVINAINQVLTSIPDIPEFPEFPTDVASSDEVREVREELTNLLLILFGLAPCPAGQPQCASPTFIKEIKVQAVEVSGGSSDDDEPTVRHWLLTTTVNGRLVDVDLNKVLAFTVNHSSSVDDVTGMVVSVPLGLGLRDVSLSLPFGIRNAKAFQFDVGFTDTDTNTSGEGSALIGSNPTEDDDL